MEVAVYLPAIKISFEELPPRNDVAGHSRHVQFGAVQSFAFCAINNLDLFLSVYWAKRGNHLVEEA
jgi:hypothetical protein